MKNIRRNLLLAVAALLTASITVPTGQAAPTAATMTQNADEALTAATFQQGSFASKSPPPGPTKMQPASYFKEKYAAYAKEQAAEAALAAGNPAAQSAAPEPTVQFYTGKPFDADTGTYLFPFRNYNPATASWTTPDPSGFPDGPNNMRYAPVPTGELDPLGLFTLTGCLTGKSRDFGDPPNWHSLSGANKVQTRDIAGATQLTPDADLIGLTAMPRWFAENGVPYYTGSPIYWNVVYAYDTSTSGTVNVSTYVPKAVDDTVGANIIATYTPGDEEESDDDTQWGIVQMVEGSYQPHGNRSSLNSDTGTYWAWDGSSWSNSPFYGAGWDDSSANNVLAVDDWARHREEVGLHFTAYDYIASYQISTNTVALYDYFTWGWDTMLNE